MGVSQVIYNGDTLIDLTGDTVTAETLLAGVTAHNAEGEEIVGTYTASGGSGVSITQLWENADPTKEFQGAQQLDFDDNYDLFIVTYKRKTEESDPYCFNYIIKPGSGLFAFGFEAAKISYRGCSDTGTNYIYFNNANVLGSYGVVPTGQDNTKMIPWYIYGVKFA